MPDYDKIKLASRSKITMDIAEFLKSINDIEWFSKSGSSCDKYMNVWQPKI